MKDIKWSHFLDRRGNVSNTAILSGKHFSKQMEDSHFEITIMRDGKLKIEIDNESTFFYRKKLPMIIESLYPIVYELYRSKKNDFYVNSTFSHSRLVAKVYSQIENENW